MMNLCAIVSALSLLLVGTPSLAHQPAPAAPSTTRPEQVDPRAAAFLQMLRTHVAYPRPAEDQVRKVLAQPFRKGVVGPEGQLDLYLPAGARGPLPVVVLLHGRVPAEVPAARPREWAQYQDWGAILAGHGFAAVVFNHPLSTRDPRVSTVAQVVQEALAWVRVHAAEHRLAPERVALVGFSAAGLALPEAVRRDRGALKALVAWYPLLAHQTGANHPPPEPSVEERHAATFTAATGLLRERQLPLLVVRAGADQVPELLPLLDAGVAAALRDGVALELLNVPGAPHAFDLTQDSPRTRAAIRRTLQFLEEHLKSSEGA
ncbi:MAG: alpha/beta hydrolase [Myxococcaceae bacterium]|nr:alpha/beta hydrolase [Myxococcaceae bacterium]MCI0669418.1 alpha/beta hydrolase [Myxococcaceae bacterium]